MVLTQQARGFYPKKFHFENYAAQRDCGRHFHISQRERMGAPAPSKEGMPPGKDEKQTTIPGMGDPAPAGKVVDFTAARDGAAKGKTTEKAAVPDKGKHANKAKDAAKPRRGRPVRLTRRPPTRSSRSFGARTVNMAAFGGVPIPLRISLCLFASDSGTPGCCQQETGSRNSRPLSLNTGPPGQ